MNTSRRNVFSSRLPPFRAVPFILPSNIWAAKTKPNDRIVMGFIGMGKQSRGLLEGFMHHEILPRGGGLRRRHDAPDSRATAGE